VYASASTHHVLVLPHNEDPPSATRLRAVSCSPSFLYFRNTAIVCDIILCDCSLGGSMMAIIPWWCSKTSSLMLIIPILFPDEMLSQYSAWVLSHLPPSRLHWQVGTLSLPPLSCYCHFVLFALLYNSFAASFPDSSSLAEAVL